MTAKERKALFRSIYNKYCGEMYIHSGDCGPDNRGYSYVLRREIILPKESFSNPSEWQILELLHEIGHVKTNTRRMKVYEKEFHATQWSANEAKKLGLPIKQLWRDAYQQYIWEKRQMCINHKGRNVPKKEDLIIQW